VKIQPKKIVKIIGNFILFENKILWCAQVTKTPDDNKIAVFNKGILKGSKELIIIGGQITPNSWVGTILWWKKAQNQAKKNKTSLKINNLIPHFKPSWTLVEWSPKNLASRVISRHHKKDKKQILIKLKYTIKINLFLNIIIKEVIKVNPAKPLNKGQGLIETIWKEWKSVIINFQKNIKIIVYKKQKVEQLILKFLIKEEEIEKKIFVK